MYHVSVEMNAGAGAPPPTPNASPVSGAVAAIANAAAGAANAVVAAATGAVNAATNAANSMFTNITPKNNSKNSSFNSLIPLGNSSPSQINSNKANNRGNNAVGVSNAPPTFGNFSTNSVASSPWIYPLSIFAGLIVLFLIIFAVFNRQIKQGYEYITSSFQQSMGLNPQPAVMAPIIPVQGTVKEITVAPMPPQMETPSQHKAMHNTIVEKVLPSSGSNEVYNVSQNKFTYYDAEPLCKALGAELATYEQVKDAWGKGADWCNYGWVKGQMAIYPTQKETYDKLQSGPEDQRMACGTAGINGGYFENPEMQYGVNCYGSKPSQSAHDEAQLMDEGKIPKSPETLKVDQMMNEFKTQKDSLYMKPFNDDKWFSR